MSSRGMQLPCSLGPKALTWGCHHRVLPTSQGVGCQSLVPGSSWALIDPTCRGTHTPTKKRVLKMFIEATVVLRSPEVGYAWRVSSTTGWWAPPGERPSTPCGGGGGDPPLHVLHFADFLCAAGAAANNQFIAIHSLLYSIRPEAAGNPKLPFPLLFKTPGSKGLRTKQSKLHEGAATQKRLVPH